MGAQTILVAEDEFLIRFMLADSLRELGYQVMEAADGDEGFDILMSGQVIDLIITDVRMPSTIDGMELTRRSKSLAPARPVIVCSADLVKSQSHPADEFLAKPYTIEALAGLIARLIGDPCPRSAQNRSA